MENLTLVPIGGLGNRIFALASAIAYCSRQHCRLKVVWFRDWGMGAKFKDLFELGGGLDFVEITDAAWRDYIFDRPRKRNLWLPWLYQRLAFDTRLYEKVIYRDGTGMMMKRMEDSKNPYLVFWAELPGVDYKLDALRLRDGLREKVAERVRGFSGHTVGVHIRRTDNTRSIANSPLPLFVERMKKEMELFPDTVFYVASDSMQEKRRLEEYFGGRVLTVWKETDRSSRQGIEDALVELYSLAATQRIFGSAGSSYSILASKIGNIPLEIITK